MLLKRRPVTHPEIRIGETQRLRPVVRPVLHGKLQLPRPGQRNGNPPARRFTGEADALFQLPVHDDIQPDFIPVCFFIDPRFGGKGVRHTAEIVDQASVGIDADRVRDLPSRRAQRHAAAETAVADFAVAIRHSRHRNALPCRAAGKAAADCRHHREKKEVPFDRHFHSAVSGEPFSAMTARHAPMPFVPT